MAQAVVWSEEQGPAYVGALELRDGCILLSGRASDTLRRQRRLPIAELTSVSLGRLSRPRGDHDRGLLLVAAGSTRIEVASLEAPGALRELAEAIASIHGKATF